MRKWLHKVSKNSFHANCEDLVGRPVTARSEHYSAKKTPMMHFEVDSSTKHTASTTQRPIRRAPSNAEALEDHWEKRTIENRPQEAEKIANDIKSTGAKRDTTAQHNG